MFWPDRIGDEEKEEASSCSRSWPSRFEICFLYMVLVFDLNHCSSVSLGWYTREEEGDEKRSGMSFCYEVFLRIGFGNCVSFVIFLWFLLILTIYLFFSVELMLFRDLFVDVGCILSTSWIMIWDCLLLKRLSHSMWLLICLGLCSSPSLIMWLSPVKLFRCSSTKIYPLFPSACLSTIFKRCCYKIFYVWDIRWLGSFLFIHFSVFFHTVLFLFFVFFYKKYSFENMICSS